MRELRNTIDHLRLCQQARAAGYKVSFTTDPRWLVNMAINRRSRWPDDPSRRGSARPVAGRFPAKGGGDYYSHLLLIADEVNTPRLVVRYARLGEHRWLATRLRPGRITYDE